MKRTIGLALASVALGGCGAESARDAAPAAVGEIVRTYASDTAPYARTLVIPAGYETIRLPGVIADPVTPGGTDLGDTETQTASVLSKIAAALAEVGASEADVVAMTVYLVRPPGAEGMDFDGMMRAYLQRYGAAEQPNRPVRSTVEVAGLIRPGMLVEIEVTAARKPR